MTNELRRDLPERTFQLALRIVKLCQLLDEKPGVPRVLAKQILRSGTSVGANVAFKKWLADTMKRSQNSHNFHFSQ